MNREREMVDGIRYPGYGVVLSLDRCPGLGADGGSGEGAKVPLRKYLLHNGFIDHMHHSHACGLCS